MNTQTIAHLPAQAPTAHVRPRLSCGTLTFERDVVVQYRAPYGSYVSRRMEKGERIEHGGNGIDVSSTGGFSYITSYVPELGGMCTWRAVPEDSFTTSPQTNLPPVFTAGFVFSRYLRWHRTGRVVTDLAKGTLASPERIEFENRRHNLAPEKREVLDRLIARFEQGLSDFRDPMRHNPKTVRRARRVRFLSDVTVRHCRYGLVEVAHRVSRNTVVEFCEAADPTPVKVTVDNGLAYITAYDTKGLRSWSYVPAGCIEVE